MMKKKIKERNREAKRAEGGARKAEKNRDTGTTNLLLFIASS